MICDVNKRIKGQESEPDLKRIPGLRQVWRHITAHMVLTQEVIPEEGGYKREKRPPDAITFIKLHKFFVLDAKKCLMDLFLPSQC